MGETSHPSPGFDLFSFHHILTGSGASTTRKKQVIFTIVFNRGISHEFFQFSLLFDRIFLLIWRCVFLQGWVGSCLVHTSVMEWLLGSESWILIAFMLPYHSWKGIVRAQWWKILWQRHSSVDFVPPADLPGVTFFLFGEVFFKIKIRSAGLLSDEVLDYYHRVKHRMSDSNSKHTIHCLYTLLPNLAKAWEVSKISAFDQLLRQEGRFVFWNRISGLEFAGGHLASDRLDHCSCFENLSLICQHNILNKQFSHSNLFLIQTYPNQCNVRPILNTIYQPWKWRQS